MKKVLLITGSLKIGGLETVAMQIVRSLDKEKYRFDFLVYEQKKYEYEDEAISLGCRVIHMEDEPKHNYYKYYKALKSIFKQYGPYDIVHAHTYFNSSIAVLAAKNSGVPLCIAHSHSIQRASDDKLSKKIVYNIMRKILNKSSDKFVACSLEAGNYVFGEKGFREKGTVLLNPINMSKFSYSEKGREKIRSEFRIDNKQTIIGQVGRLSSGKNQKFLLDVFYEYLKNHKAVLLIVGEGDSYAELKEYAKFLNLEKLVIFTGRRLDVPDLLSAMDIFVMSSLHEGLGIVLLEAIANGLSCVCEENAIVGEIKEFSHCFMLKGFDAKQWSNKVNEILALKRELRKDDEKELEKYSISEFTTMLQKIYETE